MASKSLRLFAAFLVAFPLTPFASQRSRACTTAVVSGAATADGRAILWKNRDTSHRDNEVVSILDGRFPIVAVANAGSEKAIWMGANAAGFCIENSLSKDLAANTGEKPQGPENGQFMLLALMTCATVEEFADLCRRTDGERTTVANIGVIDAHGGAAIFEVGPDRHVRFDAVPEICERGYLVRSNFSMTANGFDGEPPTDSLAKIYSAERYSRACRLLERGKAAEEGLSIDYFLRRCARDLADDQGRPVPGTVNAAAGEPLPRIPTKNTISRRTTVSAAVFQGVRAGESPRLTTMWTFLGDPTFSIAVPCWPTSCGTAPELDGQRASELCTRARELRDACYSDDGGAIDATRLAEIYQRTWAVEDAIVRKTQAKLEQWRETAPSDEEVFRFHRERASEALDAIEKLVEDFAPDAAEVAGATQ